MKKLADAIKTIAWLAFVAAMAIYFNSVGLLLVLAFLFRLLI